MSGKSVLVVDDEANIRELARLYLEQAGYEVRMAVDGRQALDRVQQEPPDLMVLDLMLPEVDGWDVCRRVRAKSSLPIIMLTARDEDVDKIVGLELGADDYLTKPFNPRELVARVRAVLRRSVAEAPAPGDVRRAGNVTLDPAGRAVTVAGQPVSLRAKEFDLLLAFMDHPQIVLSRDQLLDIVWGYEYFGRTRTVDVHVANLRERLGESDLVIKTVWGKGYKLLVD